MTAILELCGECGGEGWLPGLVAGDRTVEERCGVCGGRGQVVTMPTGEARAMLLACLYDHPKGATPVNVAVWWACWPPVPPSPWLHSLMEEMESEGLVTIDPETARAHVTEAGVKAGLANPPRTGSAAS